MTMLRIMRAGDGSLCLRVVIAKFIRAEDGESVADKEQAASVERRIKDFITMNAHLQELPNKSGTLETGGLGEPKFEVDGSAFEESWGRPQNVGLRCLAGRLRPLTRTRQDGPAIRATTLIKYATHLLTRRGASEDLSYVRSALYSSSADGIINRDLDYVLRAWGEPSFDLWEEVNAGGDGVGGHFYTLMVSRKALLDAVEFTRLSQINDVEASKRYAAGAERITSVLESFWNPSGKLDQEGGPKGGQGLKPDGTMGTDDEVLKGHLREVPEELLKRPHILPTLNRQHGQPKPLQVDVATLLALNHAGDRKTSQGKKGDDGEPVWAPWSERALATLDRLVEVFGRIYKINGDRKIVDGVAVGRYPEDSYDGVGTSVGHPWFLACHGVAEALYLTADHFASRDEFVVTKFNVHLLRRFAPTVKEGTVSRGEPDFEKVLRGLRKMGDGFLKVGKEYADADGKMSEQFHRDTGVMRGARELTWSFSSWLTAEEARRGHLAN